MMRHFRLSNPYFRLSLVFGGIAGAMVTLYFLVLQYGVGENALARMSRLDILITLGCVLFAMGYYRDRRQGGVLHFWQGAVIGLETAFIGTLLACAAIFVVVQFLDRSILADFVAATRQDMEQKLLREEVRKNPALQQLVRTQLAGLHALTPFNMVFFPGGIFVKNVLASVLATGMVAAIMRKNVAHLSGGGNT